MAARWRATLDAYGEDRLHCVVFAAAVPPYLLKSDDNPDGPLDEETADGMRSGLETTGTRFFDGFTTDFFSAGDDLKVSEEQRQEALALCQPSDQDAALGCMQAFGTTDFRDDLAKVTVPPLVIHGDSDAIVPFEGSGKRTHEASTAASSSWSRVRPHGFNVSHAEEFNEALLAFLGKKQEQDQEK